MPGQFPGWWDRQESNLRPSRNRIDALPIWATVPYNQARLWVGLVSFSVMSSPMMAYLQEAGCKPLHHLSVPYFRGFLHMGVLRKLAPRKTQGQPYIIVCHSYSVHLFTAPPFPFITRYRRARLIRVIQGRTHPTLPVVIRRTPPPL